MKYEIAIRVDTNDADYVTEVNEIDADALEKIEPLIKAIKNFQPHGVHHHNYPTLDCVRSDLGELEGREYYVDFSEDVVDIFEDLLPFQEYGFHAIESITITPAVKKVRLL